MKYISLLLFFLCCTLGLFASNDTKHEIRAVWLTTNWGLDWPQSRATNEKSRQQQQQSLCAILDEMAQMNLNTVFFQARIRGDVAYRSVYEPFNPIFTGKSGQDPGYDPLQFAIDECHKRGLQCHAWVVCIPVGTNSANRDHGGASVLRKHPEWCLSYMGEWYLDPGNPATAQYLANMSAEIVQNYNVDGIHLDYIRYPDDPTSFPDHRSHLKYGNGTPLSTWRRENINRIVATIYDRVKGIASQVKVSSAVIGKYNSLPHVKAKWSGIECVSQDAAYWLKTGKHDFIAPMMYYDNHFDDFLENWQANSSGHPVVAGLGVYQIEKKESPWPYITILKQINSSREQNSGGVAYYRWENLRNSKQLSPYIKNLLYRNKSLFPPLNTSENSHISPPSSAWIITKNGPFSLQWSSVENATGYVIYGSEIFPVNTNIPANIVGITFGETCFTPKESRLFWAITAHDGNHKESDPVFVETELYEKRSWGCYDKANQKLLFDDQFSHKNIDIFNASGVRIHTSHTEKVFNLPACYNGIYRLKIYDKNEIYWNEKLEINN